MSPIFPGPAHPVRRAIYAAGALYNSEACGDYVQLEKAARLTLELSRQINNRGPEGAAYLFLGKTSYFQRSYSRARGFLKHALELFGEIHSPLNEAEVLTVLGELEYSLENYTEAEGLFKQALVLDRSVGIREAEIDNLLFLAKVAFRVGRYAEVHGYAKEGLGLAKEIGDKRRHSEAEKILSQLLNSNILPG